MASFKLVCKLVVAQMVLHPARVILTSLAVIASAAAVAWVVSGYDALVSQFDENANKYLGRYDLLVTPQGGPPGATTSIEPAVIEQLQQDPAVLEVNAIAQSRASVSAALKEGEEHSGPLGLLIGSKPPVNGAPPLGPTLVATPALEGPYEMVAGEWLTDAGEHQAVLSQGAAKSLEVEVGDRIVVTTFANQVRLEVVGIIEQAPQSLGGRRGGGGGSGRGSGGNARGGADAQRASREGQPADTPRGEGRPSGRGPRGAGPPQSSEPGPAADAASRGPSIPGGSGGSTLATNAVYVRFATAELINGFASKPAILQIALRDGFDVEAFHRAWDERLSTLRPSLKAIDFEDVREGLATSGSVSQKLTQAYSATGLAALAAVFIIFSTLSMGVTERSREFAMLRAIALSRGQVGMIIAVESLALAIIGWLGGLLAGWVILSIAAQSKPDLFPDGAKLGWTCVGLTGASVVVGALGAAIVPAWQAMRIRPLDALSPSTTEQSPKWPWVCLAIGLVMISMAPISVFFVAMDDASRTWLWAVVSYPCLLVGMALVTPAAIIASEKYLGPLVARLLCIDPLLLRGHLSTNLWRTLGTTLALASGLALYVSAQTWGYSMLQPFLPGEWMPDAIVGFQPIGLDESQAAEVAKIDGVQGDLLPLALEQSKIAWPDDQLPRGMGKDNAIVIGLDAPRALASSDPFLDLKFVAGSPAEAAEAIASSNSCLVSEDYEMATGIGVGDLLTFTPPNAPQSKVEYQVVGVVSLPGWQWFTKFSGVRRHFVRTGGIVLADHDRVRSDFALGERTEFFWLHFDGSKPVAEIEQAMQSLAEQDSGESFVADGVGQVTAYRPFARLTDTASIRTSISRRADGVIWSMSQLPLVTLLITSLAVVNTIIASVRARTWELAVLRSIGTTRGELVRLVIAESLLIGLVVCLVSLSFGLIAGWCGVGMSRYSGAFFGGPPTFLIPWSHLSLGFALALGACLLAAVWPAVTIGRAKPLALLQAGRTAM
ncbi:ABC transporter permease [Aeoliella mucimassa]|uniref:FtsX-like permease family protein n=1 Tax=Aeoliella mucimassa TaxID=2527972 RepID=A0A518ATK2_9BACT|nr:FtsX-like permease family protein [Aeoliella mucimassa]QDU58061.1 FtsX-like permease family protein [Aeoliella mucimassa]